MGAKPISRTAAQRGEIGPGDIDTAARHVDDAGDGGKQGGLAVVYFTDALRIATPAGMFCTTESSTTTWPLTIT